MTTVARLLLDRVEQRPDLRLGVAGDLVRLDDAMTAALSGAELLAESGLRPGSRIAVTAGTSTDQLVFWMACQLAGIEVAMVNPTYPDDLLGEMFAQLRPDAVAAGLPDDPGLTCEDDVTAATGTVAAAVEDGAGFDALVCASDTLALGARFALGAAVPVVGYDDTPVAAALGLSSVHQPVEEVAHATLDLLLHQGPAARVASPGSPADPRHRLLAPRLVLR